MYKLAQENGWTPTPTAPPTRSPAVRPPTRPTVSPDIQKYIDTAAAARLEGRPYYTERGISDDTAARFNLGYDRRAARLVIPYPETAYYVSRSIGILPNGPRIGSEQKYLYPAGSKKPLFNAPALKNGAATVFVTEGQIDAITLEQSGGAAVAATEPGKLLSAIHDAGAALTAAAFLIVPDADPAGRDKAEKMREELRKAGQSAEIYPLPAGYHDSNDMFVRTSGDFAEWVRGAADFIEQGKAAARAEYQKITGQGRLAAFRELIRQCRPIISTGFPALDTALGDGSGDPGGLCPSLYTVGAISSLGKTDFVLQMADSIAAAGHDVLFFPLEMSPSELMARSVSRITCKTAENDGDRKTAPGILRGHRYDNYSPAEFAAIDRAMDQYSEMSARLFFVDSPARQGIAEIRAAVARHVATTGTAPVVIVDYLQLIAPGDPRATDKTNMDAAILGLKQISKDCQTPVICISSFNRSSYANRVSMEALKESGAIEYSSDVIIGLQFQGVGEKDFDVNAAKEKEIRDVEAVVLKNRNGITGKTVRFDYEPRFHHFSEGHLYSRAEAAAVRRNPNRTI